MVKRRARGQDFLDEIVAERAARNPAFSRQVAFALRRRELLRELARRRERQGLSQDEVAARMSTSQPAIAKIEAGDTDPRISTLDRYAAALGFWIEHRLVPIERLAAGAAAAPILSRAARIKQASSQPHA